MRSGVGPALRRIWFPQWSVGTVSWLLHRITGVTLAIYLLAWQEGQPIGREEQGQNLPEDEDPESDLRAGNPAYLVTL